MEERIILVAYDEGSFWDRFVVHFTRRYNPKVEKLYESHLETIFLTHDEFEEVVCPRRVEMNLLDIAENAERFSFYRFLSHFGYRLGATSAVAAMLVLSVVLWSNTKEQHELEEATLQARQSLALIGSIMNGTTKSIHEHVILEQTSKPLRESIYKGTETIRKNI